MKTKKLNSYVTAVQATDRDVRQLGIPVSEYYEAESVDGQTVINLNFSVDINNKRQVWLFIDGRKLVEGSTSNYTFTNVVSNVSSQITLSAPIQAGLPIQAYKLGAYQESFPNPSSVTATLLNDVAQPHKMAQDAFQPFVKKEFVTAPYTTIVNRAQVEAGSLKAIAGVERVHIKSFSPLVNEYGANGELVYEVNNKDSRIRLLGSGWTQNSGATGIQIYSLSLNDYAEITFYGTGLNMIGYTSSQTGDFRVTVDGGAESANAYTTGSAILTTRNYTPNNIIPIASGLSLGWHTIKLRVGSAGTSNGLVFSGFEFLNERTNLAVLSGIAYNGAKQEVLPAFSTSNFNAGVVGTRGARVIKYLKDGVISQAVQEVNAASAFLTSANHTNEEIVRKINFREFGANRADDFSTLSTSRAAAFTLDDGTTTLVSNAVRTDAVVVGMFTNNGGVGNFTTITFVGTGLDFIISNDASTRSHDIYVDGTLVGTVTKLGNTTTETRKLCSGLPYGTHTVKIQNPAGSDSFAMSDFIIYQPKKPALPTGAIELADYNVMADLGFAAYGSDSVASGVVRKMPIREFTYVGSHSIFFDATLPSGWAVRSSTINDYSEYSFFGTGFELSLHGSTGTYTATIKIDGNLYTGSASVVSPTTWTAGTGTVSGNSSSGGKLRITGLSLGIHRVRITVASTQNVNIASLDIITPIHINTTMKVGSLSLKDSRVFSPIVDKPNVVDLSKAKAWVVYDKPNNKILRSYNISQVLSVATGIHQIYFDKVFRDVGYVVVSTGSEYQILTNLKTTNYCNVSNTNTAGTGVDGIVSSLFFGELEDESEF